MPRTAIKIFMFMYIPNTSELNSNPKLLFPLNKRSMLLGTFRNIFFTIKLVVVSPSVLYSRCLLWATVLLVSVFLLSLLCVFLFSSPRRYGRVPYLSQLSLCLIPSSPIVTSLHYLSPLSIVHLPSPYLSLTFLSHLPFIRLSLSLIFFPHSPPSPISFHPPSLPPPSLSFASLPSPFLLSSPLSPLPSPPLPP